MTNVSEVLTLAASMQEQAEKAQEWLYRLEENTDVILSPKQVNDLLTLITRLTVINSGLLIGQLEGATER